MQMVAASKSPRGQSREGNNGPFPRLHQGTKAAVLDFAPGVQLRLNPQQVWSLGELLNPPPETGWVTRRSWSQDAGTEARGQGRYNSSPQ